MRKMKANIIAFESPIPKIYDVLPPPRDDMDDVLAILFTGPCKPTPDSLKEHRSWYIETMLQEH
jgi:hypothetical protein